MKSSNLAERLEEFSATVEAVDTLDQKPARRVTLVELGTPRQAPRRLSLETRRIRIRDAGLRYFRVF